MWLCIKQADGYTFVIREEEIITISMAPGEDIASVLTTNQSPIASTPAAAISAHHAIADAIRAMIEAAHPLAAIDEAMEAAGANPHQAEMDAVYSERNKLVALLASLFPAGIKRTAIPGWDEAWHGCVYIDLPTGQASWHYHDREAELFAHLPPYPGEWDGHTTEAKYERIVALAKGRHQVKTD